MENALLLHNKHWNNVPYDIAIERDLLKKLLKFHHTVEIQIISGIRRSGKSSLLKLYINEIIKTENPKSILFVNFDDPNYSEIYNHPQKIQNIIEISEKLTQVKIDYLFFDEIQAVLGWEKFIKSVYDANSYKKICITGSNSQLLSSNYSTLLSGRYITNQLYPLSLGELLHYNNFNDQLSVLQNKPSILNLLENTLKFGLFPEIIKKTENDIKHETLINYFDSILIKDCIVNKNIRDIKSFKDLSFYLLNNISSLYSYNSISKAINTNDITIKDYINAMTEAFLLYEIPQFSFKVKQQIKSKRKIYCIDNGLITAVSLNFSENRGKLLENLVFSEFLKMGNSQIYFYNENKECDFIVKIDDKLIAVQVCFEINNSNREREISGIMQVQKIFPINYSLIITFNQTETINDNFKIVSILQLIENIKLFC